MNEGRQVADETPPVVSVVEAARRLGRSVDGVRGLIRRGRLTARCGNSGQLLVELPPGAAEAATGDGEAANDDDEALALLREQLEEARDHLEHWRTEAEVRARDVLIEQAREALAHERSRGDRLAAELTEARRPWVVRVAAALRRQ